MKQFLLSAKAILAAVISMCSSSVSAQLALPVIPSTNSVVRYQRVQPVFKTVQISKARGDILLSALDGGKALEPWMKNGLPPGVVCALPVPARIWMEVTITNGNTCLIGLSQDGGLLYLTNGLYAVTDKALSQTAQWVTLMKDELRLEVVNTPKPFTYKLGTIDDVGTLSDAARLFYGDANKWKHIYDANRKTIRNPHILSGHEKLIIPKLK